MNGLCLGHCVLVNYGTGRKVAIDASMSIYQFLIAVRQDGSVLTNAEGETTRSEPDTSRRLYTTYLNNNNTNNSNNNCYK